MATFTPDFELEVSNDGRTVTVKDISNYPNDQGYLTTSFSRTLSVLDSVGAPVVTLTFAGTEAEFTIESDVWAVGTLVWTGLSLIAGTNFTKTLIYPIDRISKSLFLKELAVKGCCENKAGRDAMVNADLFFSGMEYAAPAGEGIRWQSYANTAYKLLDSLS